MYSLGKTGPQVWIVPNELASIIIIITFSKIHPDISRDDLRLVSKCSGTFRTPWSLSVVEMALLAGSWMLWVSNHHHEQNDHYHGHNHYYYGYHHHHCHDHCHDHCHQTRCRWSTKQRWRSSHLAPATISPGLPFHHHCYHHHRHCYHHHRHCQENHDFEKSR